ncbi:hypothetical protein EXM22_05875 [Oceanispirochaeta crateris]|uniref:DUF4878 domain-containing protein n=1 Tax=Oceanispirochaeta crateris TaxID=2518645 RepID=A0A5C1QK29_9SPIO|nr:hypothetical protein [Oceanispirochaeta crateris]QEN07539.1 hypothetical protein EXM22_05875 [Oceanispirochaeta crateris]
MKKITPVYWMMILIFAFFSCKTVEPVAEEQTVQVEPAEEDIKSVEEPLVAEKTVEEEVIVNNETGFAVSAALYEQTFNEMKELIENLNEIISDENYDKWKLFLSDNYIQTYNDKEKLKQISEQSEILADNNIVLGTLKDYFEWVVVPSRSKAVLDDIVFMDDNHITAYTLFREKRTILYELENVDGKWLISVW